MLEFWFPQRLIDHGEKPRVDSEKTAGVHRSLGLRDAFFRHNFSSFSLSLNWSLLHSGLAMFGASNLNSLTGNYFSKFLRVLRGYIVLAMIGL